MPASAYREFDQILRTTEHWLTAQRVAALGMGEDAVRERLTQRLVEVALPPFLRAWQKRRDAVEIGLRLDGLHLRKDTGAASIAPLYFGRLALEFGAHWGLALAAIVGGFGDGSRLTAGPVTLLFGVGNDALFSRGTDARFVDFCKEGPIRPLREASQMIIQAPTRAGGSSHARFSYDRYPLLALARHARLTTIARLALLGRHLLAPFAFVAAVVQRPLLALLASDFAVDHVARTLHARGEIEAIVITNTLYTSQPLWMRRFAAGTAALHMVWYSQNTVPLVYTRDGIRSDLPHNRHIRASHHWVWTEGYRAYLLKLGLGASIHVVGPILWYLPPRKPVAKSGLQIAVFDVTPVNEAYAEKVGLINNYYSAHNMVCFLRGVIALKAVLEERLQRPVRVLVKHKRAYSPAHDARYIDFVATHSGPEGPLTLAAHDDDMYSMIAASDLTIVVPYSSPAHVSVHVGVPAIYFDAAGLLEDSHERGPLLDFASGDDALINKGKIAFASRAVAAG